MNEAEKYFIVRKKAVPEVLLKVVEAKRLLDSEKAITVQEATESVGISRSSFYKYKDDIFPFHDNARGKTFTFMLQMDDEPGLLSCVLNEVARNGANILTINQTIPVNGIALITLSVEILPSAVDVTAMIDDIEALSGIHSLKILARE
jgi:chorismate mutase